MSHNSMHGCLDKLVHVEGCRQTLGCIRPCQECSEHWGPAIGHAGLTVCDVLSMGQATMQTPPSALVSMMRGLIAAYLVVLVAYFPTASAGYAAFGNTVSPDVLLSVSKPAWLIRAANFMVVVHLAASFQVIVSWLSMQVVSSRVIMLLLRSRTVSEFSVHARRDHALHCCNMLKGS